MNDLYHAVDFLPLAVATGSLLVLIVPAAYTNHGSKSGNQGSKRTLSTPYFNIVRLVLSISLFLTIAVTWYNQEIRPSGRSTAVAIRVAIAYGILVTLLSALDVKDTRLTRHADLVFLSAFGVIAYNDIWPLFTFEASMHRLDLYSAIQDALLCILGVIIPLTTPREYRPIDDSLPLNEPNPEQTVSWLSLLLYSWLDPLIIQAYKSQHFSADALFPLADYDHVAGLISRNSLDIDSCGVRRYHIFFDIIKAFSSDLVTALVLALLQTVLILVSPFALQQSLGYMEGHEKEATIRPIVWIMLLFIGPMMYSISYQRSAFILSRVSVCTEALLSDLIFKHALRIRLRGDGNDEKRKDENKSSNRTNLVGTINNHLTTDLTCITGVKDFLSLVVGVPIQVVLCVVFLYRILGWSSLVGAAAMAITFPVPGYIGSLFQSVEVEKMKTTDGRVQLVTEVMNLLRMVKLFGWEHRISNKIQDKRIEELTWNKRRIFLQLMSDIINFIIPIVILLVTYSTYTLVAKQKLSASIVFSSIAVFDIFQLQIHMIASSLPGFIQAKVALDRINTFLSYDDIITDTSEAEHGVALADGNSDMIGLSHVTFSWNKSEPGTETPRNKPFVLTINDDIVFHSNGLNLVTGPTGSGKTSLLMALLGEMHSHPSGPSSWYNLPRHLGVAYASQESWILNQTIRDNILFGSDFDEERYTEVLFQCALGPDLALMEHGDMTEVGERGITLSGGQKARITLARAVYSSAEILLLDDVFAALDVHTSHSIVDNCFRGKLLKGRTIILATHHVSLVADIAEYLVTLDKEGHIQSHGPLKTGEFGDSSVADTIANGKVDDDGPPSESASTLGNKISLSGSEGGKLTAIEEVAEGHVSWSTIFLYLLAWGGRTPILNWSLMIFGIIVTYLSLSTQSWYLGYWAEQYRWTSEVDVVRNIVIYSLIVSTTAIVYSLIYSLKIFGILRASQAIHDRLIDRILGATFRWLDTTPIARVITRCTQDIDAVDGAFPRYLNMLIEISIHMLVKLAAVIYLAPPFALLGLTVAIVGRWCGEMYMKTELPVKREMSNAKAPVLAHLEAALAGLVSIRAYGAQSQFIKEYESRIDRYSKVARTFHALNRWVAVRLQSLSSLFVASLAAYMMYGHHNINPSNVGFSLDMAVNLSDLILWWIMMYNNTEINGNSLERIASYMDIEQEADPISKVSPPAYWPASGELRVQNLSARYSSDGPNVLHNLTFHIRSGERIGIVGRTGSGKTSLTLSLLRGLPTEGEVYYDGILTSSVELDVLRSNLTIIPQSAELLNGTIRQNLDPFDQFDDAVLHNALRSAGLSELQEEGQDSRLTLDTPVTAGGANFSVGQRQIVALARAMVRESKLIILDEATSAIDHKTDIVIQKSLREMTGVTQLIIAHRLQSVMDTDRIMVLDAGRIVELDAPSRLLQQEGSIFRALVYASKDSGALLAMVDRA